MIAVSHVYQALVGNEKIVGATLDRFSPASGAPGDDWRRSNESTRA